MNVRMAGMTARWRSEHGWLHSLDRWSVSTVIVGVGLATVHAIHVYEMLYYGFVGVVVEGIIPLLLAGVVAMSGPWLHHREYAVGERQQVFKWMAVTGVLVGLLFGWALSHQYLMGVPFPHASFVAGTNVTAGALLGVVIGIYDVTSKRDRDAIEAERQTVMRQRSRLSVFNRVLRHNIRNDANVILGHVEEIENQTSGEVANRATIAARKTTALVTLSEKAREIDDVIASGEGGEDEFDVRRTVESIAERFDGSARARTIVVDLPESPILIRSSKRLFEYVIVELVRNAIDHAEADPLRIHLGVREIDDDRIEVIVADNGRGLPSHERLSLRSGVETDLEHSSGLGLWLINWGVETLGGEMIVGESELGGAAFSVNIPKAGTWHPISL